MKKNQDFTTCFRPFEWAKIHSQKKEEMKALEKNVREVENFLKNSMKEFEVLDFGKDGKVHWTNTKTGRMFRNLIK